MLRGVVRTVLLSRPDHMGLPFTGTTEQSFFSVCGHFNIFRTTFAEVHNAMKSLHGIMNSHVEASL